MTKWLVPNMVASDLAHGYLEDGYIAPSGLLRNVLGYTPANVRWEVIYYIKEALRDISSSSIIGDENKNIFYQRVINPITEVLDRVAIPAEDKIVSFRRSLDGMTAAMQAEPGKTVDSFIRQSEIEISKGPNHYFLLEENRARMLTWVRRWPFITTSEMAKILSDYPPIIRADVIDASGRYIYADEERYFYADVCKAVVNEVLKKNPAILSDISQDSSLVYNLLYYYELHNIREARGVNYKTGYGFNSLFENVGKSLGPKLRDLDQPAFDSLLRQFPDSFQQRLIDVRLV